MFFDLVIADRKWEWNYHIIFWIDNCSLLTWNLAYILSNLKDFKKSKKRTVWIWRDIFYWSHHTVAFYAGNLALACKMFSLSTSKKFAIQNNRLIQLHLIFYRTVTKNKLKVWKFQSHRRISFSAIWSGRMRGVSSFCCYHYFCPYFWHI